MYHYDTFFCNFIQECSYITMSKLLGADLRPSPHSLQYLQMTILTHLQFLINPTMQLKV